MRIEEVLEALNLYVNTIESSEVKLKPQTKNGEDKSPNRQPNNTPGGKRVKKTLAGTGNPMPHKQGTSKNVGRPPKDPQGLLVKLGKGLHQPVCFTKEITGPPDMTSTSMDNFQIRKS